MFLLDGSLVYSATDLSGYLACGHLPLIDREAATGVRDRPAERSSLSARYGDAHEANYLEALKRSGRSVAELARPDHTRDGLLQAQEQSRAALAAGYDVVYQATFFDGTWLGHPDFLFRNDCVGTLGPCYDVVDTKLARHARATALVQVALYGELLAPLQGCDPEELILALGDGSEQRFRYDSAAFYLRSVKQRFLTALGEAAPYPYPVEHCELCSWSEVCEARRRDDDHLSLIADIRRLQVDRLEASGTTTLRDFASEATPLGSRVSPRTIEKLHRQAVEQLASTERGALSFSHLPKPGACSLASLPPADPDDLFFDMEGFPYAEGGGLEYLFGWVDAEGAFTGLFAEDPAGERRAFEALMDEIAHRRARSPGMHVYHYASYEKSALSRLSNRHAVREEEVAELLRHGVLVDLYRVVRSSLVVGAESYSIKSLEPLYGVARTGEVKNASESLEMYQQWLDSEPRDEGIRQQIADYNAVDCRSTLELRNWLMGLVDGAPTDEIAVDDDEPDWEPSAATAEWLAAVEAVAAELTAGIPEDPSERDRRQQALSLLAHLLKFHQREENAAWREYFTRAEMTVDELREDGLAVAELTPEGEAEPVRKSRQFRYSFPTQDVGLRLGERPIDPVTEKSPGTLAALESTWPEHPERGLLTLLRGAGVDAPHPDALIPRNIIGNFVLRTALLRFAYWVAGNGIASPAPEHRAARQLLLGAAPRLTTSAPGSPLAEVGEHGADALLRVAPALDGAALAVQGPPGSGKTYSSAQVVIDAVTRGRQVGVTANSHRVIENLLVSIVEQAERAGVAVRVGRRSDDGRQLPGIVNLTSTKAVVELLDDDAIDVVGGTAWLMANAQMAGKFDLLVVDEAGQFSLANTLASLSAATDALLVGDPAQLDQPIQASHPEGSDVSALAHVLGPDSTMPPELGLFLDRTRRMHPAITEFISTAVYDGKLSGIDGLERQSVAARVSQEGLPAAERLSGAGIRWLAVRHDGNRTSSSQEAERIALAVGALLGGEFTDSLGTTHEITTSDVLVVTPYNAQIATLRDSLPRGVEVGTVDRFQGREAPVVFYSMATSSTADLPRDFEFLFSLNRLNVAISRGQALAVLVCSPALLAPRCRTPQQVRLVNALCQLTEYARGRDLSSGAAAGGAC